MDKNDVLLQIEKMRKEMERKKKIIAQRILKLEKKMQLLLPGDLLEKIEESPAITNQIDCKAPDKLTKPSY